MLQIIVMMYLLSTFDGMMVLFVLVESCFCPSVVIAEAADVQPWIELPFAHALCQSAWD